MGWKPLGGRPAIQNGLPGQRGRYLILVGSPLLSDGPRWVHFSYRGESFCVRDYTMGVERRQEPGLRASDVWQAAIENRPATGVYYHPVDDVEWWSKVIRTL